MISSVPFTDDIADDVADDIIFPFFYSIGKVGIFPFFIVSAKSAFRSFFMGSAKSAFPAMATCRNLAALHRILYYIAGI